MPVLTVLGAVGPLTAQRRAEIAAGLAQAQGPVLLSVASDGLPLDEAGSMTAAGEVASLAAGIAARAGSVAVLSGPVRGAALDLALAASMRVASAGAVMSCPEAALGLVPAAGGSQRLPRLVGGDASLRMLLDGAEVSAVQALASGLVDHVVEGDGMALAMSLAMAGAVPERRGLRDGRAYLAAVAAARHGAVGARARMIDCVEMALVLPIEQGLAYEHVCFQDLAQSEESLGLRHAAAVSASTGGGAGAPVSRVGIWGAGAGATRLAMACLQAGLTVQLAADDREAVVRALADIAEGHEALVQAGTLPATERDAAWARLLPQVGGAGLAGVDLAVLTEAADLAGPRLCIGIPVPRGAMGLSRFDRLAEVQALDAPAKDVALAIGFARAMGWQPVLGGRGGPVALRLAAALSDAVLWAEARGLARADIARSLAAQGIAGEGGAQAGAADETALRVLAALANAGARAIDAGEALSAAHVDAVALAAGLMARWTGGPMHCANRRGLLVVRRDLWRWQDDDASLWSPAPLMDALIAEGRGF